ncbi:MAG: response regulator [Treponema sp.]|nr:response regulator [Treponema sp.]
MSKNLKIKKQKAINSKRNPRGLRTTLFLMSVCPFLLLFGIGSVISFTIQRKTNIEKLNGSFMAESDKKVLEFDCCLDATERAVHSISNCILNSIDEKKILSSPEYKKEYMSQLQNIISNFAMTVKDSVSVYFRMNASLYGPTEGLFLTGDTKNGFMSVHPTDISLYSPTEFNHVIWYYLPDWEEKAMWLTPYENANINMHVFSFVEPLYKNGEFLGVVGIDLNMATLKGLADDIKTPSMSALLLGKDYEYIYYTEGQFHSESADASIDILGLRQVIENGSEASVYKVFWDGQQRLCVFRQLRNDMKLILLLPKAFVTASSHSLLVKLILLLIICIILCIFLIRFGIIKIVAPVNELSQASSRLSRGEFKVRINYKSANELGALANNMRKMAVQLDEYVDYISEQRQSEREAKESAINASKAKSNFLANMSHEIRTPINAVLGMNEMILRESKKDDIRTYALNIKSAGNTLLALVNDVLDFSKIESGKLELIKDTYDLSSIIIDLISIISERIEKNGLEFKLNINKDIPSVLNGDSAKLKQCILNLLTNAVKYTQKGSVTLSLDYKEIPYSDGKKINLLVKVADTGIGIKKEDLEKLFQPFERIEENRNRTVEGTGLGMNIVQKTLEVMDTKLEVQSEYGAGSVFSFSVVQDVISTEPVGDIVEKINESSHSQEVYKEKLFAPDARLLFIDDTVMNLEVVKGLLKNTKIKLDCVLSGEEGLECVRKNVYDIIFIDHRMPKMDGLETLDAMKVMPDNKSAGKPCVVLTANAINGAKEMYLGAGFTDYLSKPVSPDKLEEMIIKYLPAALLKEPLDSESEDEAAEEEKEKKLPEIDGIDMATAKTYCGSEELMVKMFGLFQSSIQKNADELQKLLDEEDVTQYKIKVHALKSSARTIGATQLSEMALALETAAGENKLEQLKSDTPALLSFYRSYADRLLVFAPREEKASDNKKDKALSKKEIKKYLADLGQGCDNFDLDSLENIVGELQMNELPADFKETFKTIREFVKEVDFEGLSAFLKTL